jgi:hypothetical protein
MNNYKIPESVSNFLNYLKRNSQELFVIIGKVTLLAITVYLVYQLIVYLNSILRTIEPGISIILDFIILASFLVLFYNQNRQINNQNKLLRELITEKKKAPEKSRRKSSNKK